MDLPVVVADEVVVEEVFGIEHGEAGDADEECSLDGFVDQGLDVAGEEFRMAVFADAGRELDCDGFGFAGGEHRL